MEKKTASPSIAKLALVLLAVSAIVALVLGLVNHVTKDRIAELAAEKTATAYANVLEAANYEELDAYENNGTITKLVRATDESGATVGYVAETYFSGAQGMITMVVGVDADNSCSGIYVTKSSETAGLGALASETQAGAWRDNLAGKTLETAYLAKDGGDIAAIAGATITSRACTDEARYVMYVTSTLG